MDQFNPEVPVAEQQHGTVNYSVGRTKDVVVLEFDTPVKWLALSAQGAKNLAADLRKMAAQLDKRIGLDTRKPQPAPMPRPMPKGSTRKRKRMRMRKRSRG